MLRIVDALAPDDVWVGGNAFSNAQLVEHWDGQTWQRLPDLPHVPYGGVLAGIAALTPSSIYVAVNSNGGCHQPSATAFVAHWDGSTWALDRLPEPPGLDPLCDPGHFALSGIAASGQSVWAVGYFLHSWDFGQKAYGAAYTAELQGSIWSYVRPAGQFVNEHSSGLAGAAIAPNGDVWAVGRSDPQCFAQVNRNGAWGFSTCDLSSLGSFQDFVTLSVSVARDDTGWIAGLLDRQDVETVLLAHGVG